MMWWLPATRATLNPAFSNARTTRSPRTDGTGGIRPRQPSGGLAPRKGCHPPDDPSIDRAKITVKVALRPRFARAGARADS